MKAILPLLVAALAAVSPASANEDLERLRAGWKEARERALQPVDRKYLTALEALKARLTREGKLEQALLVEAEFEAVANGPGNGFKGRVTPATLVQGEWRFDVKSPAYTTHLTLGTDGTVRERGKAGAIGRWSIKASVLRMEFKNSWNEFGVEYEGAPVLVEKKFDGGKREDVTLTQVR